MKLKDQLSRVYRKWYRTLSKRQRRRLKLDEGGILDQLKASGVLGGGGKLVDGFRECLAQRHWFAHGRYWAKPASADRLDPEDVFHRANNLILALPN